MASGPTLTWNERLHYRDRLRAARYSALADSEGFSEICFVIEAIGLRLHQKVEALGKYKEKLFELAKDSIVFSELTTTHPMFFSRVEALFEAIRVARNDAMHSGVYARHVTQSAIELCIGLEEALMAEQTLPRKTVADFMVKSPVEIKAWQPVAYARQLMLAHSFSFLPVCIDGTWKLISDIAMAKYLGNCNQKVALASDIESASQKINGLDLIEATVVKADELISALLAKSRVDTGPTFWLVDDGHGSLAGVLSPFELM